MPNKNKKLLFSLIAIVAMVFAFPQNAGAALAIVGGYHDNESSNNNEFSASSLDEEVSSTQTGLEAVATAQNMVPGTSVLRDANIENVGQEDFQYQVEFEKVEGSNSLCDALHIKAEKNGTEVYNNDLFDFSVSGGTLNSGDDDDWNFTVTMPLGTSHNVENLDCDFNLKFTAWQTGFVAPTQGWIDEEEISDNEITAGDWEPAISGVASSDPLDTKGKTNSDMSKISISWSTDENTTSNVFYDTVSQATCSGYALASSPVDITANSTDHEVTLSNLTAGTTYYYRAVSEDSGEHEVCSNEYSFTIPNSSADSPSDNIVLNEFVPNPFGVDSADMPDGEWVELYNTSGTDEGVNGWYIYDSTNSNGVQITSANTDTGDTVVPAHGWLVVYINKAYFNNDGDTVQLYSNDIGLGGVLLDSHVYTGAVPEGKSFARFPDGVGVWIDPDTTPGKENQLKEEELKQFRMLAVAECFDAEGNIKKSKKDICQKGFLEYLSLIDNKKSKKISSSMQDLLKKDAEGDIKQKEEEEEKKNENLKEDEKKNGLEEKVSEEKETVKTEEKPEIIEEKPVEVEKPKEEEKTEELKTEPVVADKKEEEDLKKEEPKEEPKEEIESKEDTKKEEIKEEEEKKMEEKEESEENKTI